MSSDIRVDEDLIENPTTRVPVCLCLDTSSSMSGMPIAELNEGVHIFLNSIKNDEIARYSAEIAIVTFDDSAKEIQDFTTVDNITPPRLVANGFTNMNQGVELALNLLEKRKEEYKKAGVDYYQPWLVIMTDGEPTEPIDSAVNRTLQLEQNKHLTMFLIGIGNSADMNELGRFSNKRPPLKLKGLNFQQFFEWLSKSVSEVSNSMPGEKISLPKDNIDDIFELDV
jgi:uncharacterized protein YegL